MRLTFNSCLYLTVTTLSLMLSIRSTTSFSSTFPSASKAFLTSSNPSLTISPTRTSSTASTSTTLFAAPKKTPNITNAECWLSSPPWVTHPQFHPHTPLKPQSIATSTELVPSTFKEGVPSPVQLLNVRGKNVYIKRDDLISLPGTSSVVGNKARKFYTLNNVKEKDFPSCIVSYGGAQSNAMLAIAAVVSKFNNGVHEDYSQLLTGEFGVTSTTAINNRTPDKHTFKYYTKPLGKELRKHPVGNLVLARKKGMDMKELTIQEYTKQFKLEDGGSSKPPATLVPTKVNGPESVLWIPQGGGGEVAKYGCETLAREVHNFWKSQDDSKRKEDLTVVVACGTGVLAYYLNVELDRLNGLEEGIMGKVKVLAVPCVGDDVYLRKQMEELFSSTMPVPEVEVEVTERNEDTPSAASEDASKDASEDETAPPSPALPTSTPATAPTPAPPPQGFYPEILKPLNSAERYRQFGRPVKEVHDTWTELNNLGLHVDLLYGAPTWEVIFRHLGGEEEGSQLKEVKNLMYYHCGGMEGVGSQLVRYRNQGIGNGEVEGEVWDRITS